MQIGMAKPDKFDEGTSLANFIYHFEICAELNG
jgi:hypothetical protein